MTLHEENDTRTNEDIKASNDGILKTVNEYCEKAELPKRANAVILNKN